MASGASQQFAPGSPRVLVAGATGFAGALAAQLLWRHPGFELAGVGACLWVWWKQIRGRLSLEAACLATLTFVMLGSKVLSAQYLIWLMPMWSLYRLRVTWLLAAAANLIVFPYVVSAQGFGYLPGHTFAVGLPLTFLARDVLIAAGTVAWLRTMLTTTQPAPDHTGVVLTA